MWKIQFLSSFPIVVLVAIFLATTVSAQSEDEVNRIIRGLAPITGQKIASQDSTPSVERRRNSTNLVIVTVDRSSLLIDTTYALDFNVYFKFDSAEFASGAHNQMSALGIALTSLELSDYRYLVAGHTDAVGTADYNRELSERRAHNVRDYLLEHFPIGPNRLISVGFGEDRLKSPEKPKAAINRRVEVAMIAN